jgi:hypothetical protein
VVSVCIRILTQTSERIEKVKAGEIVAIASIHAVSMQLAENMIGCAIGRSSNPTLSAMSLEFKRDTAFPKSILRNLYLQKAPLSPF